MRSLPGLPDRRGEHISSPDLRLQRRADTFSTAGRRERRMPQPHSRHAVGQRWRRRRTAAGTREQDGQAAESGFGLDVAHKPRAFISSLSSAAVLSRTGAGAGAAAPRPPRPRPPPPPPGTPIATSSGVRSNLSLRSSFAPFSARNLTRPSPRLTATCSALSPLSLTALTSAPFRDQQLHRLDGRLLGSGVPPRSRGHNHQRGGLVSQPQVGVGALVQQQAHDGRVVHLGRAHQRRGAIAELRVAADCAAASAAAS